VKLYEDDDKRLDDIISKCGGKEYKGNEFLEEHKIILRDLIMRENTDDN